MILGYWSIFLVHFTMLAPTCVTMGLDYVLKAQLPIHAQHKINIFVHLNSHFESSNDKYARFAIVKLTRQFHIGSKQPKYICGVGSADNRPHNTLIFWVENSLSWREFAF